MALSLFFVAEVSLTSSSENAVTRASWPTSSWKLLHNSKKCTFLMFFRGFFRRELFSFLLKQFLNLSAKLFMHWSFYFMWEVTTSIYTNLEMPLNHAAFKWLLHVTPHDSSQAAWAVARHLSPSHVFGAPGSAPTKEPLWKNMTNSFLVLCCRADKHWVLSDLSVGDNKEGGKKKPC